MERDANGDWWVTDEETGERVAISDSSVALLIEVYREKHPIKFFFHKLQMFIFKGVSFSIWDEFEKELKDD